MPTQLFLLPLAAAIQNPKIIWERGKNIVQPLLLISIPSPWETYSISHSLAKSDEIAPKITHPSNTGWPILEGSLSTATYETTVCPKMRSDGSNSLAIGWCHSITLILNQMFFLKCLVLILPWAHSWEKEIYPARVDLLGNVPASASGISRWGLIVSESSNWW